MTQIWIGSIVQGSTENCSIDYKVDKLCTDCKIIPIFKEKG